MEYSVAESIEYLMYFTRNVPCLFTSRHIVLDADSRSAMTSAILVVLYFVKVPVNLSFSVRLLCLNRILCLYRSVQRCTMYSYPSNNVSVKL